LSSTNQNAAQNRAAFFYFSNLARELADSDKVFKVTYAGRVIASDDHLSGA
jgi:hypothetical protein